MRKTITLSLILGLCLTLCACSSIITTPNTSTPSGTEADNSKTLTLGDIATVDGFEFQIKEVNWYAASDFDVDCLEPEEGFEYIVIVFSAKNTAQETKNAPMSYLLSADDKSCNQKAFLSLYKNKYKVNLGATMANETAEAYAIYQIPGGSNSFKLQILSNGFGSPSDYIVFNRDDIQ